MPRRTKTDQLRITFGGHATAVIRTAEVVFMTDPMFSERFATRRRDPAAPRLQQLDRPDVVLLSHSHIDHLDLPSLEPLLPKAILIAPPRTAKYLRKKGVNDVIVLRHGQATTIDSWTVHCLPARHGQSRLGAVPQVGQGACGFVITGPGPTVLYSGDTNYFNGFVQIAGMFDIDIALLNISLHLPARQFVRAAADLHARRTVPMHWGAYRRIGGGDSRRIGLPYLRSKYSNARWLCIIEPGRTTVFGKYGQIIGHNQRTHRHC